MSRDTPAADRGARRGWAIACVVAWIGAFVATHVPAEQLPNLPVESDKTLHFLGYLFLGLLLLGSLSSRGRRGPRRWLTVVGVMVVYAAFDEGTQPLVNRYAAWGDAWADILGGLVAIGIWEAVAGARRLARSPAG